MDNTKKKRSTSNRKRPLSTVELEAEIGGLSDEDSNEYVLDFSEDDSIADRNYIFCSNSESDSADQQSYSSSRSSVEHSDNDNNIQTNINNQNKNYTWNQLIVLHQKVFHFDDQFGVKPGIDIEHISVADSYKLFVTDDILQVMVAETNRNAEQVIPGSGALKKKSRLSSWKSTDTDEMKQFLGLLLYMGLVRYPKIHCYWSKKKYIKTPLYPR